MSLCSYPTRNNASKICRRVLKTIFGHELDRNRVVRKESIQDTLGNNKETLRRIFLGGIRGYEYLLCGSDRCIILFGSPVSSRGEFNMVFQLPPSLTAKGPVRLEGIKREGENEKENSLSPYQAQVSVWTS